jgi:hypothetical protein
MFGKHKFRVGQRVRLSAEGKAANIVRTHRQDVGGVVQKVDRFNSPTVLWDWRKTAASYHAEFIEPDRRRQPAPEPKRESER